MLPKNISRREEKTGGLNAIAPYGKCSKIINTSCLTKRPRQTVQTQIRLLLKKQSDLGIPCLRF